MWDMSLKTENQSLRTLSIVDGTAVGAAAQACLPGLMSSWHGTKFVIPSKIRLFHFYGLFSRFEFVLGHRERRVGSDGRVFELLPGR